MVNASGLSKSRIEQAIILAAGEGQRLRPFTTSRSKVMIPIANKPILQHVIEALVANGICQIMIVVGYRKEQLQNYFGSGKRFDVTIDYVVQEQQLGTAHALNKVRHMTKERFMVLSGDNIIEPDTIAPLIRTSPNTMMIKEIRFVRCFIMLLFNQLDVIGPPGMFKPRF